MKIITRGHMVARRLKIKLVDGSMITGKINLIQRGETENRVSDIFVGRGEPFVVVFEATLDNMTNEVLVINKQHILWVIPQEEEFETLSEGPEINSSNYRTRL